MKMHHLACIAAVGTLAIAGRALAQPEASAKTPVMKPRNIEEVVVTATRSERDAIDVPGSVQVINSRQIEDLGAVTMNDIIVSAVGMVPTNSSGRVASWSLRGTGAGRTLVLIDGRRLASGFRDIVDAQRILLPLIDRIEIVRGPTSALYGSDAIGGVVNIITRKPDSSEVEVKARYDLGDADRANADLVASLDRGKFGAIFSASAAHQEELDTDLVPGFSEVDNTDLRGAFAQARYQFNDNQQVLLGSSLSTFDRIGNRPVQGAVRERTAEDERNEVFFRYEGEHSRDVSWLAQANWSRFDSSIAFDPRAANIDTGDQQTLMQVEGQIDWSIKRLGALTVGADYREEEIRDDDLPVTGDTDNLGAFVQLDSMLARRTNLVLGLRADKHSEFGDNIAPRAALVQWIGEDTRLRAAYGQGFKAPTLSELNVTQFRRRGREILLPNPDLKPESSQSFELGIEGSLGATRYTLTGFYNDIEDRISQSFLRREGGSGPGGTIFLTFDNLVAFTSQGAELEVRQPLPKGFFAEANVTFLETELDDPEASLAAEPRWRGFAKLGWVSPNGRFRAAIRGFYTDSELRGSGIDVASSTLIGLHAEYRASKEWVVQAGVRNLSDEGDETNLIVPRQIYTGLKARF